MRLVAFLLLLLSCPAQADALFVTKTRYPHKTFSFYALQIVTPRATISADHRFRRAYPGIEYEVQPAAIGGAWPYTWELTDAPSGATINVDNGTITWPNPQSNDTFGVKVTDYFGVVETVSWSVVVGTAGFIFVDDDAPDDTGAGTIADPLKTINGWYLSDKIDDTYVDHIVYYRAGTYATTAAPVEDNWRLAVIGAYKPNIWLAYPGEAVTIDVDGSHIAVYGSNDEAYFEGFTVTNMNSGNVGPSSHGFRMDGNSDDVVFRKLRFTNLPAGSGGAGTNSGGLMVADGDGGSTPTAEYWSFLHNECDGIYDEAYCLGPFYDLRYIAVYWNIAHNGDLSGGGSGFNFHGFSGKQDVWDAHYFENTVYDWDGKCYNAGGNPNQDLVFAFNNCKTETYARCAELNSSVGSGAGQLYSFRNTYYGGCDFVHSNTITAGAGPMDVYNDVIVGNGVYADNINWNASSTDDYSVTDVLSGTAADNIVDANGELTSDYDQYKGTHGHKIY